ncbi:MAG: hypothetical protein QOI54_1832 [Actinomycetota bacterium]|jgi:hypothetical protein|nr:hypothetical protein [Actinomycetota bacterium]
MVRPGSVVKVDGRPFVLWSLAALSGWWAQPASGGSCVRLRQVSGVWRVAREPRRVGGRP